VSCERGSLTGHLGGSFFIVFQGSDDLFEIRQQALTARTGTPMSEDNIWLQGRRRETAALEVITAALEAEPDHHSRRDGTSATGTRQAIGKVQGEPIRIDVTDVPGGTSHYALTPDDDRAPVVIYRRAASLRCG